MLERRYGAEALQHGYVAVPHVVTDAYAALGVTRGERALIETVWTYWRDDSQLPRVAESVLAHQIGASTRTVEKYIARLCSAGLVRVIRRRGAGGRRALNLYELRPLIDAAVGVARARQSEAAHQTPGPTGDDQPRGQRGRRPPRDPDGCGPAAPTATADRRGRGLTRDAVTIVAPDAGGAGSAGDEAASVSQESDLIARRLTAIGGEWGDPTTPRGVARAHALQRRAGLSLDTFVAVLDEAIARTRGQPHVAKRTAYMFAVLEDQLVGMAGGRAVSRVPPPEEMAVETGVETPMSPAPARAADGVEVGRHVAPPPTAEPPALPEGAVDADDADAIWRALRAELKSDMTSDSYHTWLAPARVLGWSDGALRLAVATTIHHHWLDVRLRRVMARAMTRLGRTERLEIILEGAAEPG